MARAQAIAEVAADVRDLEELRRRMVADWHEVIERERGWSLLLIEFWVHAAREPELRGRLRDAHLRVREAIADALAGVAERAGAMLAMPAAAVMALGNGLYDIGTRLLGGTP